MGTSKPAPAHAGGAIPRANDHWKQRWNRRLAASTIIAVFAHLLLFVVGPMMRAPDWAPAPRTEMVQLERTPSYRDLPDPGGIEAPEAAGVDEVAVEADGGGLELMLEERVRELAESFVPRLATASLRAPADPLNAPALNLAEVEAHTPELAPLTVNIDWPRVRNPNMIERFVQRMYDPVHERTGVEGLVNLTLWITERGAVDRAEVRHSSGQPILDQLALSLSEVVVFSPARRSGSPVPVTVALSIRFQPK